MAYPLDDIARMHIEQEIGFPEKDRPAKKMAEKKIHEIIKAETKYSNHKHGYGAYFDRFDPHGGGDLGASPHSLTKLKACHSTLEAEVYIEGSVTPQDRGVVSKFGVQLDPDSSPINFVIKALPSFPYFKAFHSPSKLSPHTQERAGQIPISEMPTRTVEVRIFRNVFDQHYSRAKSQSVFNGVSAQQLSLYEGTNQNQEYCEFLHLLACQFGGLFERANIVVGTWCANSHMIILDNIARLFLEQEMSEYLDITIVCTMEKKLNGPGYTDQAKEIHTTYETDTGFLFSQTIDAHSHERPSMKSKKLTTETIMELYSLTQKMKETAIKENDKENGPLPTTPLSGNSMSFHYYNENPQRRQKKTRIEPKSLVCRKLELF